MKKKYIRMTYAGFILFDGQLQHAAMAQPALTSGDHIISAGFFAADENGRAECYGESVSLRVKSRPDDTEQLREFLGLNSFVEPRAAFAGDEQRATDAPATAAPPPPIS